MNTELLELYYFYFRTFRTFTTCTFSEPTLSASEPPRTLSLPRHSLSRFRMPVAESVAVVSCTASARAQPHARQHRTRTHARRTHANTTRAQTPHARTQAAHTQAQTPAPQRPASCSSSCPATPGKLLKLLQAGRMRAGGAGAWRLTSTHTSLTN